MPKADVFRQHLSLIGRPTTSEEFLQIYTPEAVLELAYAPEGHTNRLESAERIAWFMGRIGEFFSDFQLGEPTFYETPTGVVVEYHGESTSKETGRRYVQDYVAIATFDGDRIAHIREYYNPTKVLWATGEID
jgi:ketosteroid isomerase-like protein